VPGKGGGSGHSGIIRRVVEKPPERPDVLSFVRWFSSCGMRKKEHPVAETGMGSRRVDSRFELETKEKEGRGLQKQGRRRVHARSSGNTLI